MDEEINEELFRHLVHLAALELDENEEQYLRSELNMQLKAVRELLAIPIDSATTATSHGVPFTVDLRQSLRNDFLNPYPDQDGILQQAPEVDENYLIVPEIPHEDLE